MAGKGLVRGKAWGNALGGYKTQPRDASGRFGGKAKKRANFTVIRNGGRTPNSTPKRVTNPNAVPRASGQRSVFKKADKIARSRGGGVVPYHRHGYGHHTAGVNAGISITPNRRISGGVYLRTDNLRAQKRVSSMLRADEQARMAIGGGVAAVYGTQKRNATWIKRKRDALIRKGLGKERNLPNSNAFGRAGTDRNGLPTLVVQYNSPRGKKERSRQARDTAIVKYNEAATRSRGHKVKKPRPQRRKKNGKG
ncbi:hypothetical protein BI084_gp07 [Gordonia phage Terapin]|uniref:Uncharacterized protein n=4 Tax=Terapinvirus terapin TaxID=2734283 RepID=A0A345MB47_9CAUD|nr:hypothetical protein BI084_gp07 [Gordonia phage Terapin]AVP43284.1 hypothetical protein PBI_DJOKOVIC_7 [Gordonia phage Djokovic]AXH67718.1 hypothetical protein SEA_BEYONCAGE_7 [Gordonia phage Beyoncage]QOC56577.1 hypothetical protein SEA_BITESIZE_7 [Gordonia phage BiteSize]QYW00810.1 hypothetical protein SEA_MADI_7 [Gordonia phage Madi]AOE44819.1 hypothetical protein SEA_TERAPIN_7 [Gordonia phage Terapin]